MNEPSSVWWDEIAGPNRAMSAVLYSLRQSQSVLFLTDLDFPWRWEFRGAIETQLLASGLKLLIIDCADDYDGGDIEKFLINRIAPDKLPGYLQHLGNKKQYIKSAGIFSNLVIWIKGIPADQNIQWIKNVGALSGRSFDEGLFLIELESKPKDVQVGKAFQVIAYRDYVTQNDLQLFCYILASQKSIPDFFTNYVASIVANLCVVDGEIADKFIETIDFLHSDPIDGINELFQKLFSQSSRGITGVELASHPFYLLRTNQQSILVKRVWKAQLQVAYPVIEFERIGFIQKWEKFINNALMLYGWDANTDRTERVKQFGVYIENPFELELSTLVRMTNLRQIDDHSKFLLYIPDETARDRLLFIYRMRNKLAHNYNAVNCTPEEMRELLTSQNNDGFF